jgi:hypothetical protein
LRNTDLSLPEIERIDALADNTLADATLAERIAFGGSRAGYVSEHWAFVRTAFTLERAVMKEQLCGSAASASDLKRFNSKAASGDPLM